MNPSAHTYKKMAKIMTLIKDHNIIPGQILSSHVRWKKCITVGKVILLIKVILVLH